MYVSVMSVGPMNVSMGQPLMHMVMVVRLRIVFLVVQMTVMFILIMRVLMPMCESFMDMEMPMPLPIKTQDASEHQRGSEPEECGRVFAKQNQ